MHLYNYNQTIQPKANVSIVNNFNLIDNNIMFSGKQINKLPIESMINTRYNTIDMLEGRYKN